MNISIPATSSKIIGSISYFLEPIILTNILLFVGYTKEYIIRFTAETGCAVSLPNGVLYANGTIPTYIAGHIYEINIVNGCAVVAEFY